MVNTSSKKPRVTVLIPVYNGEKYIHGAITSILAQTYTHLELLIVDDGSTDRTVGIVKDYEDGRVRLIQNEKNAGPCATRNRGIQAAAGEYIAMLDADDIACPDRLAEQVSFLDSHPDFSMVGSSVEMINSDWRVFGIAFFRQTPDEIPPNLLFNNCFAHSTIMAKKSVLLDERYKEDVFFSEDFELWVRVVKKYKAWNLPRILVRYRLHPSSTGQANKEKMRRMIRSILASQLRDLKVDFSEQELELHFSIGMYEYGRDREYVESAERWFKKLAEANARVGIYKEQAFLSVLRKHWFRLCISRLTLGPWMIQKAIASEFGGGRVSLLMFAAFARDYVLMQLARSRRLRRLLGMG